MYINNVFSKPGWTDKGMNRKCFHPFHRCFQKCPDRGHQPFLQRWVRRSRGVWAFADHVTVDLSLLMCRDPGQAGDAPGYLPPRLTASSNFINRIFMYLAHRVVVAACRLSVASCGILCCVTRDLCCVMPDLCCITRDLLLQCLVAPWHVEYSFPHQGSNPCPLHWKADS